MTDETRTESARTALDSFVRMQGLRVEREFALIDLITDLLHLAEQEGLDAQDIARKAELHYRVETLPFHMAA